MYYCINDENYGWNETVMLTVWIVFVYFELWRTLNKSNKNNGELQETCIIIIIIIIHNYDNLVITREKRTVSGKLSWIHGCYDMGQKVRRNSILSNSKYAVSF